MGLSFCGSCHNTRRYHSAEGSKRLMQVQVCERCLTNAGAIDVGVDMTGGYNCETA